MKLRVFTVDAFTREAFSGNPAAVIPLEEVRAGVLSEEVRAGVLSEEVREVNAVRSRCHR